MRYVLALLAWHALGHSLLVLYVALILCIAVGPRRKR